MNNEQHAAKITRCLMKSDLLLFPRSIRAQCQVKLRYNYLHFVPIMLNVFLTYRKMHALMHTYKCIYYIIIKIYILNENHLFYIFFIHYFNNSYTMQCYNYNVMLLINLFAINRGYLKFYLGKKNNLVVIKLSAKKTKV